MDVFEQAAQDSADHRRRVEARARLIAAARGDGLAGHRETIRLLTIVLALEPYTRATAAPCGWPGRPIEPTPPHLQRSIPQQRRASSPGIPGRSRTRRSS